MQRRAFLQQTTWLTLGASLGAPHTPLVLGHGPKRYTVDVHWSRAYAVQHPVKDAHEMVFDRKGRLLLLTNDTRNNVLIYSANGEILDSWGHEYPGAHGLTIFDENGTEVLYICDTERHQVIKTTLQGRVLHIYDWPREAGLYEKAEEYIPTETTVAPNGDLYVADGYGKDYILRYNARGEYLGHFGGKGSEAKHLNNAHGICYDGRNAAQPVLCVSSRQQQAFKRYTLAGEYLDTIPVNGAWVCRPVVKGDYLYAAVLQSQAQLWQQSGCVVVLDKDNRVVSNIGGNAPHYTNGQLGELYQTIKVFQYPHDVCVDANGNLYVCQWNSGHVYPYKLTPVQI